MSHFVSGCVLAIAFVFYFVCAAQARQLASALVGAGLARNGGKIGIFSHNRVEWMVAIR